MGNFYSNFATRGPQAAEVVAALREGRRRALVTPTVNDITIVYDQAADELDEAEIDAVGSLLSRGLGCPVLGAAVADDDELWLVLYEDGKRVVDYSSRGRWGGTSRICRAFGRSAVIPIVWPLMHLPYVVFESMRHAAFARLVGIPNWCVATGYRYIAEQEELPNGLELDDLMRTDDGS